MTDKQLAKITLADMYDYGFKQTPALRKQSRRVAMEVSRRLDAPFRRAQPKAPPKTKV